TLEERNEENAALRALARQTAEVADTAALLRILCTAASTQCGGHGATLISVEADHGELVSAVGLLEPARGWRFAPAGSLPRDIVATMSHELRTPLTALAGYEELLVDAVLGPLSDSQREVLERMRYVTQHLSAMIEDVLAYTNLETGGEVVRPTDFLAADLLSA